LINSGNIQLGWLNLNCAMADHIRPAAGSVMLNTNSLATLRFLELSHDRSEPRAFGRDEARRFLEATERFRSSPNDGGKTRVRRLAATGWPLI